MLRLLFLAMVLVSALCIAATDSRAEDVSHLQDSTAELFISTGVDRSHQLIIVFNFGERDTLSFSRRVDGSGAFVRERSWSNLTPQCASLSDTRLVRTNRSCKSAAFLIATELIRQDRVYPGVVDMGMAGLVIHSGYLAIRGIGQLRVSLPDGYIVLGSDLRPNESLRATSIPAQLDEYFVVSTTTRVRSLVTGQLIVASDGADDQLVTFLSRLVENYWNVLSKRLRAKAGGPLTIALHLDSASNEVGYHGDVTNNSTIRLSLFGAAWRDPAQSQNRRELALFLAHELIHVAQRNMQAESNWVLEGNAEFLGLLLASAVGSVGDQDLAMLLSRSVSECLLIAHGKSWPQFYAALSTGSAPYVCGLALHAYAYAGTSFDKVLDYWGEVFSQKRTFHEDLIPKEFDGAGGRTPYEFLVSRLPWPQHAKNTEEEDMFWIRAFGLYIRETMKANCDGQFGFSAGRNFIATDPLDGCAKLSNRRLLAVEGIPISSRRAAASRLHSHCVAAPTVQFATDDGDGIVVARCPHLPKEFVRFLGMEKARELFSTYFRGND